MKILRFAGCLFALVLAVRAQVILTAPQNQTATAGSNASFTVAASGTNLVYAWQKNGTAIAGANGPTLSVSNVQPASAGIYTVTVTSGTTSVTASAVLGLVSSSKVIGSAQEVAQNLPAGANTYDQVLLQGAAATITADAGQITRISYVDLTDDIVQVEFSGHGALTLVLDSASGPALAVNYNQPTVSYWKGHASIVIAGAEEDTHLSIFSVGSVTSVNSALFKTGVTYDGFADIASVAIVSANGKFGGVRTANASYFASKGLTGLYAPGVQFTGPVYVGDIDAFASATPVLRLGSVTDARINGGDLQQTNTQPIAVSGLTTLNFTAGTTSQGKSLPALANLGQLIDSGVNVTAQVVASGPNVVSVSATKATTDETGASTAEFTISRTGSTIAPLTVLYGVGGSATNGVDYPALVGFVTIPAFATSVKLPLQPYPDTSIETTETVTLTLAPGADYTIGATNASTASIADSPSTLYVANLRPASGAASSAASGLATVVLSASGTAATVNVSFSNLSSGEVGAHLFLGNGSNSGDYVLNLPLGQVSGTQWNIQGTATYTATQIVDALRNGLIFVGLDSAQFPAGELRGAFLSAVGSQAFTAPSAPPAVSLTNITATDAARLLTQATFGPKKSEIDALTGGSVDAWITTQMGLAATSHRTATAAEKAAAIAAGELTDPNNYPPAFRQRAWFQVMLSAPDQLRQRVAFALSQILVVSDASLNDAFTEPLAAYNDLLANQAFGNFRTLLEQVTLSPVMGTYLSHLKNAKADPITGTNPDENYAREVMQLFTIGLVQLQPDGTLKLDAQGLPIPTYNQATITETAKVFTGWGFFSTAVNPSFRGAPPNYFASMMLYPNSHESAQKTIVDGIVIPANLGGTEDLKRALDALFYHANTAPFISRQLIQRLVTDNPSPAYVYRVAQTFADDGTGTRGNLGAVVRAILTDYEARSPAVTDDPGYGKLKEPLLRYTALLRGFDATSTSGRNLQDNLYNALSQAALRAPSVFNFFEPGYVYPGPLAAAGLVAPEFQITNDTTAISTPNQFRSAIFATATGNNAAKNLVLNLANEQSLSTNVPALLDRLALILANGQLSTATRTRIATALGSFTSNTTTLERAQSAILLIATSPEGSTQK